MSIEKIKTTFCFGFPNLVEEEDSEGGYYDVADAGYQPHEAEHISKQGQTVNRNEATDK